MNTIKYWQKKFKPLASLKLAVFVILALATVSAVGTFYEAHFNDATRAQQVIYHSWYSYAVFALLTLNLTAVIFDRYPWKRHHIGFISAHVGIIVLILGSLFTRYYGVDGSMAIGIGEKSRRITIPSQTDVIVYSALATGAPQKIFEKPVEFFTDWPSREKPFKISLPKGEVEINGFEPYSMAEKKVKASDSTLNGPGLRFQIANERVSEAQWLVIDKKPFEVSMLGPAQIVLSRKGLYNYKKGNVLLLEFTGANKNLDYSVFTASKGGITKRGKISAGDSIQTGWMGLTFRMLKYYPNAKEEYKFSHFERKTDEMFPAVRVKYDGKEQWTGINGPVKYFTDSEVYYVMYVNRMIDLGFHIRLDDFKVGRYQGTRRAASYKSFVHVLDGAKEEGPIEIYMNEPLKYNGFTFYQSSFQEDPKTGRMLASVLSINQDPGRFWKYLGCILIVFGIIHLFYFRGRKKKASPKGKK